MSTSDSSVDDQPKTLAIWGPLPEPVNIHKIKPQIHVYRKNKTSIIITDEKMPDEENTNSAVMKLAEGGLLPTKRFIFISHGFRSDGENKWIQKMKNDIIEIEDQTVAIIKWGGGAKTGIVYKKAASNTQIVGEWVALYAKKLNEWSIQYNKNHEASDQKAIKMDIWGIGHSLGAHLMGKAGRDSKVFNRITGLDPAGPCFQTKNKEKRLSKNDAQFVDVIHTDGMGLIYFGTLEPLGSVDFYPNFGFNQPQKLGPCIHSEEIELMTQEKLQSDATTLGSNKGSSHKCAYEYFIWSISNPHKLTTNLVLTESPQVVRKEYSLKPDVIPVIKVIPIDKTAEMGYYADSDVNITGNYYINIDKIWL